MTPDRAGRAEAEVISEGVERTHVRGERFITLGD